MPLGSSGSNLYFNNFNNTDEQDLVESLIVESIGIYGHQVYYCPRTMVARDDVFNEDRLSTYNKAYPIDVYVKSFDSYEGDGTFLSKFNLEIRNQVRLTIARRTYEQNIGQFNTTTRPQEGDLIYSAMLKRLLVIQYVSSYAIFYQMGSLQVWDVVCEMFEYSNERLNTGIPEIDGIETKYTLDGVTSNAAFEAAMSDTFADNQEFQVKGAAIIDWTDIDPFSSGLA